MASVKNTLRSRIAGAVRGSSLIVLAALTILATIFGRYSFGWVIVLIGAIAIGAATWFFAEDVARRLTIDLDALLSAVNTFNSGLKATRARATGAKEVRQLADGFNKLASQNEEALTKLNAEEQRKMQFVSDVSHELRTPLTAIRGAAETLLDGCMDQADQDRFLSTIAMESERLTRLANDLLTLQRIEGATGELPLRRFNLHEAISRAGRMLEPLFETRGVTFGVVGDAPEVLGDIDRIQQVVANLVDNATRMVGEGGRIWVELSSASRADLGAHVPAKSFLDIDRFAVMSICDNGPGIPEDDIPHLFDRFFRTDLSRARNRGGAGLGLSIVRAIVVAHGGTIDVENRPLGGLQFNVYLPVPPDADNTRAQLQRLL